MEPLQATLEPIGLQSQRYGLREVLLVIGLGGFYFGLSRAELMLFGKVKGMKWKTTGAVDMWYRL